MIENLSFLGLARCLSTIRCFPERTVSEITESLKSWHSTWCLSPEKNLSQRSLNFTGDSMPLALQPSTSACLFPDGQSSEVPSMASISTLRLTLLQRYLFSTESPIIVLISTLWIGLNTSLLCTMCLGKYP